MIILRFYLNNECNFTLSLMYLLKTLKKKSFAWTCRNIRYINFPGASSPGMEGILFFHEDCLFILFFVLFLVLGILYFIIFSDSSIKNVETSWFEIIWMWTPIIITLLLIVPSFFFCFLPSLEMGVIKPACIPNVNFRGPQGFWECDYTIPHLLDKIPMQYDSSYSIHDSSLQSQDFVFFNMGNNPPVVGSIGDDISIKDDRATSYVSVEPYWWNTSSVGSSLSLDSNWSSSEGSNLSSDVGSNVNVGSNLGSDVGSNVNVGSNLGSDVGSNVNVGSNLGSEVGSNINVVGSNLGSSASDMGITNLFMSTSTIRNMPSQKKWFSCFKWAFRCCLPRRSAGKDGDSL